jgi:DNA repair protein SbcC/Rad50
LEQLSDATRVQLLLALRLGSLEQAERGCGPLPLCLDEVLATTDPQRYAAIANALLQIAESGRQVLYVTADPAEVEAFVLAATTAGQPKPAVHRVQSAAVSGLDT